MLTIVLTLFVLGLVAPLVVRATGRAAPWLLAAGPAVATVFFLHLAPAVRAGVRPVERYEWIPGLGVELAFAVDGLSLIFALLVCGIGTLVVLYTGGYLETPAEQARFQSALLAFMASMLGLVLADHLIALFLFWELTSVTSYLLIGFHHEDPKARRAALQALLVTASGGLALLGAFLLLGMAAGSLDLGQILARTEGVQQHPLYGAILALVVLGAFSKSAQFPFQFWLPGAMAAPSPASAYLHSSTMVKAGVYLLARLHPTLGGTEAWFWLLVGGGGVTMLLGAWLSLRQTDLKRLFAYSTVSVLGLLVFLLGVGTPAAIHAALALILAHAFYKGTLFLVTGAVDHGAGSRDVQVLSGLRRAMPWTTAAALPAALSMAGVPLLLGFAAKELALKALVAEPLAALLTGALVLAGALLAAAALTGGVRPFFGPPPAGHPHEVAPLIWLGPLVLGAASLVFGFWPWPLASFLVAPAQRAIVGAEPEKMLAAWYGFDGVLVLSLVSLAVGGLLFWQRERVRGVAAGLGRLAELGPDRLYDRSLAALFSFADLQTGWLQRGTLARHLRLALAAIIVLVGSVTVAQLEDFGWPALGELRLQELALAALIAASAVIAAASRTRLKAVAALGVVGFGIALVFLYHGAPDLAMTQFVIETLTVVLVVLAFFHLPDYRRLSARRGLARDALLAAAGGALMSGLVLLALEVGITGERISGFFASESVPQGHGRNVVNVILVDFRALDTLGEITVLAIAGVGVAALLKMRLGKEARK